MRRQWVDTHIHVSDIAPDGTRREHMLEDLLDVLDRADADLRFVISCDGPYLSRMVQDPASILQANRLIHELTRGAPGRLYGSCTINPNFLAESRRAMDLCFGEWGFVMLGEMLQYMMDYQMDSDPVEELVRAAVEYHVPVQVHLGTYWHKDFTGSTDGMDHMRGLLRAADRVPEANYVLAHAIGCGPTREYVSWADMFLDTLAAYFPEWPGNFWVEIRDFHCPALRRTLEEVPNTRLLAGTDWTTRQGPPFQPYGTVFEYRAEVNPFPPSVGAFVGFLRDAGASENTITRIALHNARDLLRLQC